ncbi:MAG: biotin/lipoyl-containing protein, partial [Parachlamydiales bacterium]
MEKEVLLPKLGESLLSATVVRWYKREGEKVALDEPLLEVSTDKVAAEIPSPFAGTVKKIAAPVNEEIRIGALLCLIETEEKTASLQTDS